MSENPAMRATEDALVVACDPKRPEEMRRQALDTFFRTVWLGGFAAFLRTAGVDDTVELEQETLERYARYARKADEAVASPGGQEIDGALTQLSATLKQLCEVIPELGRETAEVEIDDAGQPRREVPEADDGLEPGGDPNVTASAAVRGPFLFHHPARPCEEATFSLSAECGGCAVVVKEFRGLQLRRVLRRITKTIEPWTSRARIVHRWVWVLEWVPVEVIKTLVLPCSGDPGDLRWQKTVILDRELADFWACW